MRPALSSPMSSFLAFAIALALLPTEIRAATNDAGLIAHWTFDASNFIDSSGNGLSLLAEGVPGFDPGPRSMAVTFPSIGTSASSGSSAFVPGTRPWSVALWCRVTPDTTRFRALLSWYRCGANPACNGPDAAVYQMYLRPDGRLEWYVRDDFAVEGRTTTPAVVADGAWHHVVGTFDPASDLVELYVDGVLADTAAAPLATMSAGSVAVPLELGRIFRRGWGTPGEYLSGSLDDVHIFSRAISPAEVAGLFAGSTASVPAGRVGVRLERPAPEPFRNSTHIAFVIDVAGPVRLSVHDVAGRELTRLHDGDLEAGLHVFTWDGNDARGVEAPAGVYFYKVVARPVGGTLISRTQRGTMVH